MERDSGSSPVEGLPSSVRCCPVNAGQFGITDGAAAGEWDRSAPDETAWRSLPHFALRHEIAFDIPPGADQFTLTRTYEAKDLPDPHDSLSAPFPPDLRDVLNAAEEQFRGRATLTLKVRRAEGAVAVPAAATPATADRTAAQATAWPSAVEASASARQASAQKAEPAKPARPTATEEAVDAAKELRGLFGR